MKKHKKLALFIAPFLMLLGYIASDFYLENEAEQIKIFELNSGPGCNVLAGQCILTSGELKINVTDDKGTTTVNATFPLDKAILFLVDEQGQAQSFELTMDKNPYYWRAETPLRKYYEQGQKVQKLRLIAMIKGGRYIAEFSTVSLR